jgi:hypothetical protein
VHRPALQPPLQHCSSLVQVWCGVRHEHKVPTCVGVHSPLQQSLDFWHTDASAPHCVEVPLPPQPLKARIKIAVRMRAS